jgi:phosphoribosylamine-glycine ligase
MAMELEDAIEMSYANTELIRYEGKYHRRDIGQDLRQYRLA